MHIIPSSVHGVLDYLVGLVLILSPRFFGFQTGGVEEKLPVLLGVAVLSYSLVTRYEFGLFELLPFRIHLVLDLLSGVLLASSPWLFGFAERVQGPHLVFGAVEIIVPLLTVPYAAARGPLRTAR